MKIYGIAKTLELNGGDMVDVVMTLQPLFTTKETASGHLDGFCEKDKYHIIELDLWSPHCGQRTINEGSDADIDFGDYCYIEQKRYGVDNEIYQYKVIGRARTNYYRKVPVDAREPATIHGEMCDVVKAICCGVIEEKVETFRLQDIRIG